MNSSPTRASVLVVGAGAVGQVYGYCLHRAGADVHFLVREKYREELQRGLTLYALNRDRARRHPIEWPASEYHVLTAITELAPDSVDQIYLTFSSTALRSFDLAGLRERFPRALLVFLQPGPNDGDLIRERSHYPPAQIIQGGITLISYHTPLPGEMVAKPGMAFTLPPGQPSPMSGDPHALQAVMALLERGGLPVKACKDVSEQLAWPGLALSCFLLALEAAGWSFEQLRADREGLRLVVQALQQAPGVRPFWVRLLSPSLLSLALRFAPYAMPFHLETYLKVHFTKVADQMKMLGQERIQTLQSELGSAGAFATLFERVHKPAS